MNKSAMRAKLRAAVTRAETKLRQLHAVRDWAGIEKALPEYWMAANQWRGV